MSWTKSGKRESMKSKKATTAKDATDKIWWTQFSCRFLIVSAEEIKSLSHLSFGCVNWNDPIQFSFKRLFHKLFSLSCPVLLLGPPRSKTTLLLWSTSSRLRGRVLQSAEWPPILHMVSPWWRPRVSNSQADRVHSLALPMFELEVGYLMWGGGWVAAVRHPNTHLGLKLPVFTYKSIGRVSQTAVHPSTRNVSYCSNVITSSMANTKTRLQRITIHWNVVLSAYIRPWWSY